MDEAPLPPPGLNYIAVIRPFLNSILILTTLGSLLVPVIIILFFFSTPQMRRHPVFILNILACCCGICEAVILIAVETKLILFPRQPIPREFFTSSVAFGVVSSLFIDSILLFRILVFYPPSLTSKNKLAAVFAVPIVVKCGRFATTVMYLIQLARIAGTVSNLSWLHRLSWPKNPYILTEWCLQMIDNIYTSVFLLYKISQFRHKHDNVFVIRSESLLGRLKTLFFIALGNFVFPIIINMLAVILIPSDPSFLNSSYVLLTTNYVSILGVVFATIWTRRQNWNRHDHSNDIQLQETDQTDRSMFGQGIQYTQSVLSTLHFADINEAESVDTGKRIGVQRTSMEKRQDSDLNNSNGNTPFHRT